MQYKLSQPELPQQVDLTERSSLRKHLRRARRALLNNQQQDASFTIVDNLRALIPEHDQYRVAVYLQNDGEIDLHPFIEFCWQHCANVTFSLPVLHPVCKGHLLFLRYAQNTTMVQNKYNISEPTLACSDVIPTSDIDLILMPLVGFDISGNRLGMGGGYYDRTLAFTQHTTQKPKLVGIAHDIQQVDTLPIAPWDIPLNGIVTPTRMLHF